MQKFRASMEPFWDLKFGEYVEYLACVSSEYLTSSVLPSLMSSDGQTSRILLADVHVIPWICIDSPALHIARTMSSVPQTDLKLYCAIKFFSAIEASKLVTIEVESWHSQTPDLDQRRWDG